MIPVYDHSFGLSFANRFCAQCNNAKRFKPYYVSRSCSNSPKFNHSKTIIRNRSSEKPNCRGNFNPRNNSWIEKSCIIRKPFCSENYQDNNSSISLLELCAFYYMPLCKQLKSSSCGVEFDNPHCAVCKKRNFTDYTCWLSLKKRRRKMIGSLAMVLNFSVFPNLPIRKGGLPFFCPPSYLFDPFAKVCRKAIKASPDKHRNHTQQNVETPSTSPFRRNCTPMLFNDSEVDFFSNHSVLVISHGIFYENNSYYRHGNGFVICINLSRIYTTKQESWMSKELLTILNTIGSSVSVRSLLVLLLTYSKFAILRNLPGKNLMSLATAMLLYQCVFFAIEQTTVQSVCIAIATFLHYMLLASFTWMNVMSYDITRAFLDKGEYLARTM